MSIVKQQINKGSLQRLLLKRFGMAASTYALGFAGVLVRGRG